MNKLVFLLLAAASLAAAQGNFVPANGSPVQQQLTNVDPAGACSTPASSQLNYTTGHSWGCVGSGGTYAWLDLGTKPTPASNSVCGFGDSIIGAGATDVYWAPTFFNVLVVLSQGSMRFVHQGGVSGNTTAQMLARISADVLTQKCAKVIMDGGTNDIAAAVPLPTIEANLLNMYLQIKGNSQLPILCTIPPRTSLYYTQTSSLNAWIRKQAAALAVPLIDLYASTVDPATNDYRSGYSTDGLHPSGPALRVIATKALSDLASIFPLAHHPLLPYANTDPNNLLSNGLLLNSSSGIATGYSAINSSGHVTYSITTDANIVGNVQSIAKATTLAGDNDALAGPNVDTGYVAGDRIAFVGKISTTGIEAGLGSNPPAVNLYFYTAGFAYAGPFLAPWTQWSCDMAAGQWYIEAVVPAGTAHISLQFNVGNGTGTFRFGQMGVYNLTAMGL
jgi:lysophospholipase L1-like esterase